MIITDYNKMTLEELSVIRDYLGISYVIEDGRIVGTQKDIHAKTTIKREE